MPIFEGKNFPKTKDARRFVYFYVISDDLHINVTDRNILDWEKVHKHDLNQKRLKVLQEEKTSSLWLNNIFRDTESSFGIATTPHEANAVHSLAPSEQLGVLPDVRLWFARAPTKGLYILAHIKNAGSDTRVVLRLTGHYVSPKEPVSERMFQIHHEEEKTGRLSVTPQQNPIEGRWWKKGQDQFFELALKETPSLDAVELIAETYRGDDAGPYGPVPLHQIGTRSPLPLDKEIGTYELTKRLVYLTPRYQVYRRDQDGIHLFSDTDEGVRHPEEAGGWLLKLVSCLYFHLKDIRRCSPDRPDEPGVCFLETDGAYQLRLAKAFQVDRDQLIEEDQVAVSVVLKERLVVPLWGPGLGVLTVVALGLLGGLIYIDRASRRATARLEQINEELGQTTEELGQANKRLEQINEALTSYVDVFLHQASNLLNAVKAEASHLAETGDDASRPGHLEKIKNLVESVKERLWNSTKKFDYETAVRNDIVTYGPARFDLIDSITDLVEGFKDDGERQIEFQNALRAGCRPSLPATGEQGTVPDNYFTEALQAPIQNAIDYRFPQQTLIIISLEVERGVFGSHAVLRVSNYGPTVPKDMLPRVFDLGSRYGGATTSQAAEPAPQDDQDDQKHQGLGLFLTRQIVRAYGGTCQMDNFHDSGGSGVRVTVRLPVRLRTGPTPAH